MKPKYILSQMLSQLIDESIAFRREAKNLMLFKTVDNKSFLKEYCTIKLYSHRRSGHTRAIAENLHKFKNPLVLTYSLHCIKNFTRDYVDLIENAKAIVATVNTKFDSLKGSDYDAIFIDISCMVSNEKKEMIYEFAEPLKNVTIVFIE